MFLEYGPKCITILRYLSEAGKGIPLDAHTRIIRKLNVPQLLVALMEDGCGWIESDRFYLSGKDWVAVLLLIVSEENNFDPGKSGTRKRIRYRRMKQGFYSFYGSYLHAKEQS